MTWKEGIWYFAHPYTCKDEQGNYIFGGEEANYRLCNIRAAKLIEAGYLIYSPISHTHPIHTAYPNFVGKQVHNMWYEFDNEFIRQVPFKGIILAPYWEESKGCSAELIMFMELKRQVMTYREALQKRITSPCDCEKKENQNES